MEIKNIKKEFFILIVEPEKEIREYLEEILSDEHLNIISASSIEEAFEALNSIHINLIISEYYVGYKNSEEIIKFAKTPPNNIPIVVVSELSKMKKNVLNQGVNFFLLKPFRSWELRSVVENLLSLFSARKELESAKSVVEALSTAVEVRDPYTNGHAKSVAELSLKIYHELDFNFIDEEQSLYVGCILHDIGKIGIPDDILKSQKNPLSDEDFEMIKLHPVKGWEICKDLKGVQDSLDIIRWHHEKLDGSGYPDGISEKEIPMKVQVSTVADIYDALSSDRSYRNKMTHEKVFKIMDEDAKRGKINSDLLEILKKVVGYKT